MPDFEQVYADQVANPSPELQQIINPTQAEAAAPEPSPAGEPAAPPASPPPPAPAVPAAAPGLSPILIQRAQFVGIDATDLMDLDAKAAERAVAVAERAQLVALRNQQQYQQQPQQAPQQQQEQVKPAARPDFFGGKRDQVDPDYAHAVEAAYDAAVGGAQSEVKALREAVEQMKGHILAQQRQEGERVIDKVADVLVKEGYADVLGDVKPRPGTPQFRARYENLNAYLTRAYEAGLVSSPEELEQMARVAAAKFWGPRTQAPAAPPPQTPPAPRDAVGRFVSPPTATARPTHVQPVAENGFEAAVEANRKILAGLNGN